MSETPTEYFDVVTTYDHVLTSDSEGRVTIGNLGAGTYYLKEIETAPGYNKLAEPVSFTVAADGNGNYVVIVNNPSGAELPHSGGVGTQLILAIGAGMIAAAGALVLFNRRRGLIAL